MDGQQVVVGKEQRGERVMEVLRDQSGVMKMQLFLKREEECLSDQAFRIVT